MVVLEGTQTETNLKQAFTEEGRFDRRFLKQELAAEAMGYRELAVLSRAAARSGARLAAGHLDFLVADDASVELTGGMRTIDERTAMYAGMARTARDEGFEEIADWFETLAKSGRSHASRLRRVLCKYECKT